MRRDDYVYSKGNTVIYRPLTRGWPRAHAPL